MDFALQYLKHGKALCGAVFGSFVETFNRLVDFYANLKGDAETAQGDGYISVDRADPAHPVIRFDASKLPAASSDASVLPSAFQATPNYDDDGELESWTIENYYLMKGGRMITSEASGDEYSVDAVKGYYICAKVDLDYSDSFYLLLMGENELSVKQQKASEYYVPLYYGKSDGTLLDLRTMPQVQVFEMGLSSD